MAIKEDFVSFETAKFLKEKGFDEPTIGTYYKDGTFEHLTINRWNSKFVTPISAPTLQMAMKWLREVHNIHTEICLYKVNEYDEELKKSRNTPYYTFGVWNTITGDNIDKRLVNDSKSDTYEEASEAAIKYCLENIID